MLGISEPPARSQQVCRKQVSSSAQPPPSPLPRRTLRQARAPTPHRPTAQPGHSDRHRPLPMPLRSLAVRHVAAGGVLTAMHGLSVARDDRPPAPQSARTSSNPGTSLRHPDQLSVRHTGGRAASAQTDRANSTVDETVSSPSANAVRASDGPEASMMLGNSFGSSPATGPRGVGTPQCEICGCGRGSPVSARRGLSTMIVAKASSPTPASSKRSRNSFRTNV